MKTKKMALTAIICGASILGTSFTPALAAPFSYDSQATKIESNLEIEPFSQSVRERNETIGAILGIAAIAAIANHNNKHSDDNHNNDNRYNNNRRNDNHRNDNRRNDNRNNNNYNRGNQNNSGRHNPPPPPGPQRR